MPKFFLSFFFFYTILLNAIYLPDSPVAKAERLKVWPRISKERVEKGLQANSPIYLRLFKLENQLEVWVKSGSKFVLFHTYNICFYSGGLGTKTRDGDGKSPEGFYDIKPTQLNPISTFYLALNVGYPNKLETSRGYTGSAIMIHGNCVSIGCYAMTNEGIAQIYTQVFMALKNGQQKINLDIFPFRMNEQNMDAYKDDPNFEFWKTLKKGYDLFNRKLVPTDADVKDNEYFFKD